MTHTTHTTRNEKIETLGACYFASGSNYAGEILGISDVGMNPGVTVTRLGSEAMAALRTLRGAGVRVFVDSGAFSEVGFGAAGPFVVEEITDAEWRRRLSTMQQIADALGGQAFIVAPDKVADQATTLERLGRYAEQVRALRAAGARILVAHQAGELSLVEFNRRAAELLGFSDFVVAVPMAHATTKLPALVELVKAVRPAALHLLGLGPRSKRYARTLRAVRRASSSTEILSDSVLICSLVGRENGPGGGPRALTAALDECGAEVDATLWGACVSGIDYTDEVALTAEWITMAGIKRIADRLELTGADRRAALEDLDAFLANVDRFLAPVAELAVDAEWSRFVTAKQAVQWRKRASLVRVFGRAAEASGQLSLW